MKVPPEVEKYRNDGRDRNAIMGTMGRRRDDGREDAESDDKGEQWRATKS